MQSKGEKMMKRVVKMTSLCLIISVMITLFTACSPSMKDVIGTYSGTYTHNENDYTIVITLTEDGKYVKTKAKNDGNPTTETGNFEIDGKSVLLYDSDSITPQGSYTRYQYKNNILENNNHEFVKAK